MTVDDAILGIRRLALASVPDHDSRWITAAWRLAAALRERGSLGAGFDVSLWPEDGALVVRLATYSSRGRHAAAARLSFPSLWNAALVKRELEMKLARDVG